MALSATELASAHGSAPGQTPYGGVAPAVAQPAHAATPAMAQPIDARPLPTNVGLFVGLALFALGTLSCLGTGAAAALLRERDAVMVSYLTVPLILGGLIAPIVGLVTRGQSAPVSGGAAGGCGCLTMVVAAVGVVVFYQAIWPSL